MALKDVGYAMFKQGFNEAIAQVHHFNTGMPINFWNVTQEKNLKDILVQKPLAKQESYAISHSLTQSQNPWVDLNWLDLIYALFFLLYVSAI